MNTGHGLTKLIGLVCILVSIVVLMVYEPNSEKATGLPIPAKGFSANIAQGEALFAQFCLTCHGPAGTGSEQGPPLVHKVYKADHHADLAFYMAVNRGVQQHHWQFGNMPPIKDLEPESVGHIVAYVRELQKLAGI